MSPEEEHREWMSMRSSIPEFVRGEDGVTAYTVACEMGWCDAGAEELQLVYEVLLELVVEGVLTYREHLLRVHCPHCVAIGPECRAMLYEFGHRCGYRCRRENVG